MILVFTLCSNNYLAHALVLGKSLIRYNLNYKFYIGLVDKKIKEINYDFIPFNVIDVDRIGIQNFDELTKKYNVIELNTAVKPFYFKYFFDNFSEITSIIYLDPDIQVFSSFKDLEKDLYKWDIIITPHFTTPINDGMFKSEEDILKTGIYNLGFVAIKKSIEGFKMINWWAERLRFKAYIDLNNGLFTDQIWINFVPLFFKRVKIFNHKGYNIAYWNLHERVLYRIKTKYMVNKKYPLVFFHFSGYSPLHPDQLSKYQNRYSFNELSEINNLFEDYSTELFANGFNKYVNFPNSFFVTKEKYDKEDRRIRINKIPIILRLFRIIVMRIKSKHDLCLD